MRIRLTLGNQDEQPAAMFQGIPRGSRRIWTTFPSTAVTQALVVWLGASYLHFLAMLPPVPEIANLTSRVLEISPDTEEKLYAPAPRVRIPEQSQRSMRGKGRRAAPGPGSQAAPARTGAAPAQEASAGPPAPPSAAPLREFQMPVIPEKQSAPQTLVQMDLPATLDLSPQLRVPAVVMLSSEPARKLAPKPFIAPPEKEKTVPVPNQVALELRPPVFEAQPGYVKPPEAILRPDPKLPAPAGGVSPVSGTHESQPTTSAATVTAELPSPPVNVISLPDRPIPPGLSVVLPPLNQVSARDSASGDGSAQRPGLAAAGSNNGASGNDPSAAPRTGGGQGQAAQGGLSGDRDARGAGANGRGSGTDGAAVARAIGPAGTGDGGAGTRGGAGAGGPRNSSGTGSGGSGGGAGASAAGTGPGAGTAAGPGIGAGTGVGAGNGTGNGSGGNSLTGSSPLKIVRPISGNYDVAVVQSSAAVPGTASFLKGRPVYSVYLSLGPGKEWILQYCLPAEEKRAPQGQVVQLGPIAPLTAPYAYLILKPNVQLRNGARYGFIHAFVNVSGRFDKLVEVGDPVIENVAGIIESLEKWEFRPASKDGVPTLVEVLLCIPMA